VGLACILLWSNPVKRGTILAHTWTNRFVQQRTGSSQYISVDSNRSAATVEGPSILRKCPCPYHISILHIFPEFSSLKTLLTLLLQIYSIGLNSSSQMRCSARARGPYATTETQARVGWDGRGRRWCSVYRGYRRLSSTNELRDLRHTTTLEKQKSHARRQRHRELQ
jgi:hypothetical protein